MRKPNSKLVRKQNRLSEEQEIELLNSWIEAQKPDCGTNPMSLPPLPSTARIGRIDSGAGKPSDFSRYSGVKLFEQLPLSQKTKDGLRQSNFVEMTDVQRAALPHALCGRDIRGAAKTGSGKTLSFVVPVLEKLYRERYSAECGVGSIILSPTRELADQIFEVLKSVGRHHNFSAGLLIGGRKDVDVEKEHVNDMNILVCTPGRLLQHMDETVNFDCSQLQVLVLDEADRVLDTNFKKQVNAVISQLPKQRQTFLFSATQTKSVQDLARLSLRDPEYISVHEESRTATPANLQQTVMIVPLEEKMDMLWSFIKNHLNSKILVFFSTRKQVMFAFEAFKKLTPGIPLKCLHGKMKQIKRMTVYTQFCEDKRSVLFCTDVGSRGLDFNKGVNWVVQVDCPEDVKAYIHRVGRTARYNSVGRSVMFIIPSEIEMLTKLEAQKINIRKIKANAEKMQAVSGLLAALLVKYPDLKSKAEKALLTYLRSVHKNKDKEIFDVTKLPVDQYSASLGLPITPRIRFLNKKGNANKTVGNSDSPEPENSDEEDEFKTHDDDDDDDDDDINDFKGETVKKTPLFGDDSTDEEGPEPKVSDVVPVARVPKKKKLKINIHRPIGTRVVFDDEGNTLPPLAAIANTTKAGDKVKLDPDKKQEHYNAMREEMKRADKEDKVLDRNRRREKKLKEKLKRMRKDEEDDEEEEDESEGYDNGKKGNTRRNKRTKIASDSEGEEDADSKAGFVADKISLAEQEALALKLLSSMNE